MKKLISKVTLIAFIYKSLLMPLAAMEASSPVQHHPQETSVVQILLPQDANHPIQLAKKQKQHTATASMLTPWKRAVEYYMVGQYKDMAGEMCMSAIIGFVVIGLTSLSLYFLYSYFTHLTPFGEALTGQVSHTPASGYHQLTTAAPQQHDVLKTAWNMMARNTNLTKTLFAAAGLYLQETDITNNVWDSIKTGTKPLQGAFQYLPKDVQSVFFQLCFSPRGHLASMGNYPLSAPGLIAHQNFHDTCDPSQIDVRLAVQRPISRQLKRKGQSDAPHIAAFTHVSKTYEQLGLPSTQRYDSRRMLLGFKDNVYAQTVDHLFHSTTGLSQTVFANTMKLRADLCPGNNISLTLNEQMERLQSLMVHTDKDYTFFYLWFNTKGHLVKTGYEFSDDLEDFNKGDCDFNTGVDFDNDAHVRLAMDRNGHIVTTAQKHDLLKVEPTRTAERPTSTRAQKSTSTLTPISLVTPTDSPTKTSKSSQTITPNTTDCGTVNETMFPIENLDDIHKWFDVRRHEFFPSNSGVRWGASVRGYFEGGFKYSTLVNTSRYEITCLDGREPNVTIGTLRALKDVKSLSCSPKGGDYFDTDKVYGFEDLEFVGIGTFQLYNYSQYIYATNNYELNDDFFVKYCEANNLDSAQINFILNQIFKALSQETPFGIDYSKAQSWYNKASSYFLNTSTFVQHCYNLSILNR